MIGIIRENNIGLSKKSDVLLHKNLMILSEGPGFYQTEKILRLYNTMTYLLEKAEINKDLLDKFIEINHCMNIINTLKLDSYEYFIANIQEYYDMHKNIESLWDQPTIDTNNIFNYTIYNMEKLDYDDFIEVFDKIKNKESDIENKIYCNETESGLNVIISKDIFKANERKLYTFIENKQNNLNKDIAYSFKYFTAQVSKLDSSYESEYKLMSLDMTRLGLNREHVNAFNALMTAYNYLINSLSFRENKLAPFDEYEINKRISNAKITVERVPLVIQSRLELIQ